MRMSANATTLELAVLAVECSVAFSFSFSAESISCDFILLLKTAN